jgi:hypothetical protein
MMGVLKSLYKRGGLKATQVAEQSENNKKTIQKRIFPVKQETNTRKRT